MRLLHLGDVLGQSGRKAALDTLPMLRDRLSVDIAVVNVENSAHGFGASMELSRWYAGQGRLCFQNPFGQESLRR